MAKRGIVQKKVFEYSRNNGYGEGRLASTLSRGPELAPSTKHVGISGSSNAVIRN